MSVMYRGSVDWEEDAKILLAVTPVIAMQDMKIKLMGNVKVCLNT